MIVPEVVLTCCQDNCGISFAVPQWWHKGKKETRSWFYCPNGHQQNFLAEPEIDKVRRERDRAVQELARAEQDAADALAEAEKARRKTKRLEKRTAAGTCPCCQRTFSNMSTHMRKQHPQFVAEAVTNVVSLKKKA